MSGHTKWGDIKHKKKNVKRGLSIVVYTMDGSKIDSGLQRDVTQAVQRIIDAREGNPYNSNGNLAIQVVSE